MVSLYNAADKYKIGKRMRRMTIERPLIMLLFVAVVFACGVGVGYFILPKLKSPGRTTALITHNSTTDKPIDNTKENKGGEVKKDNMALKLALLKDYTNFVYLPTEKIGDVSQYVAKMDEKVVMLDDSAIEEKYYSTGEGSPEEREQKVLDFLNFLIDGMVNDVNNSK